MSDAPTPPEAAGDPVPAPEPTPRSGPLAPEAPAPRPRRIGWQPTLRWFSAEYLIVVLGVLTAVGLNAWWADRDARTREWLVLEDLREDFVFNKAEVQRIRDLSARFLTLYEHLATLSDDAITGMPLDSVYTYTESLFISHTYDPVTGSLEALIASGDLGLLQDRALRERLTSFLQVLRDSDEEKQAAFDQVVQMLERTTRLGGPWNSPGAPFPVEPADLIRLRSDADYMAQARLLRWVAWYYAEVELPEVEVAIDSVLVSLDANLAR
ncbi:MAG: hypothetical protein AAF089_06290 [Bacteroidota bacterium]